MKHLITGLFFLIITSCFPQGIFKLYQGTDTANPIINGEVISEATSSNQQNLVKIKIRNMSASTQTFNVTRQIQYNVPALNVSGQTYPPEHYFCFGFACFGNNINTPPTPDDHCILLGAGKTFTVQPMADNSDANGTPFKLFTNEGSIQGKYVVRYKVFDNNNPNDSIGFTVKYNEFLDVNSLFTTAVGISEVYPNPVNTKVGINVTLKQAQAIKLSIYNVAGSLVLSEIKTGMAGDNALSADCHALTNGFYFMSVETGESRLCRKFVLSK